MRGVVYIAIGDKAKAEAGKSVKSLVQHNGLPVTILYQSDLSLTNKQQSRSLKTRLPQLVDYDHIALLDADTRVRGDISPGFEALNNWDLAIACSQWQGHNAFAHIGQGERLQTFDELGYQPVQLQAGVMFINRSRCERLFERWHSEWLRWKDEDQAALVRALAREPVRVWLLGRAWNGGELIEHRGR